jgi:hypothetical protein
MQFNSMTRKAYVNSVLRTTFIICLAVMLYFVFDSNVSCLRDDGCLKSWCELSWFPSQQQEQLKDLDCN